MDFTVKEKKEDWRDVLKRRFAVQEQSESIQPKIEPELPKPVKDDLGFIGELAQSIGKSEREKEARRKVAVESVLDSGWSCIEQKNKLAEKIKAAKELRSEHEEVIVKKALKLVAEDEPMLKESRDLLVKLEEVTGNEFRRKIKDMFLVGFKGSGSRNVLLVTPDNTSHSRPKIVLGPEGFQMRPYVQARPIQNFKEIQFIVQNKDDIIKAMKTKRNLKPSVTKFEKFCDLMPEIIDGNQKPVPVGKDVLVPCNEGYSSISMPFKVFDRLNFSKGSRIYLVQKGDIDNDNNHYGKKSSIEYSRTSMEWKDAIGYLQIREFLPAAVASLKATAMPSILASEDAIEKIQDLFSKELLLFNI